METRDLTCDVCQRVIGKITLPSGLTEEQWFQKSSGYICEDCTPQAEETPQE